MEHSNRLESTGYRIFEKCWTLLRYSASRYKGQQACPYHAFRRTWGLAGDAAHRHGFVAATLSDGFFDLVKSKKINVIRTTNPIDVGDVYSLNAYGEIIEKALQEKDVDGVAFVATFTPKLTALP